MIILVILQDNGSAETIGPFLSEDAANKFANKTYPHHRSFVCVLKDKKEVFNKRRKTLAQRLHEAKA